MSDAPTYPRHHCRIVAGLLLLAVVLRSIVPTGFMPSHASDAGGHDLYAMVICTSMGTKTVYIPADKAPQVPSSAPASHDGTPGMAGNSAGGACHFLSMSTDTSSPATGTVISRALQKTDVAHDSATKPQLPVLAYIYQSRGPPVTA